MKLYKATEIRDMPEGFYWYRYNDGEFIESWDVVSIYPKPNNTISLYFPYPHETYLKEDEVIEDRDDLIHVEFYGPIAQPEF